MRLRIVRDGRTDEVEVSADGASVTVAGHTYPVTLVAASALRVELEIGGERVLVENWPDHFPEPPGAVDVNGVRAATTVELMAGSPGAMPERPSAVPAAVAEPAPPRGPSGEGVPIVPPMPGKVIEVRVEEGAQVRVGQVLLVLEAMKMRNEVTSPIAGVVRGLRVAPGANARAREPMMFIATK
jgi:biotin carboxyl carrier protein